MFKPSQKSLNTLVGVHPDLVRVVHRAWAETSAVDFAVGEGLRTLERQKALFAKGATTTMNSRHLTGHAVDLWAMIDFDGDGDLEVRWDWPLYYKLADGVKLAAGREMVPLEWGGDWTSFKDGPHFQLPWAQYP